MQVEIFITGAGPTGLLLATILEQYKIPFCIIDKKSERTQTSNALGIHARTLELLEDLNLVDAFLREGKKLSGGILHLNQKAIAKLNINKISSFYPFVLILPQSQTEKILEEHLQSKGIQVIRNAELTDIEKQNNHYTTSFNHNDTVEKVQANYVIGCDGAHSKVRELSQVDFSGEDIKQPFTLVDTTVKTALDLNYLHTFYNSKKEGLMVMFPLPNGEVRLVAELNQHTNFKQDKVDINAICNERSNGQIEIEKISWQSHFWIHSKVIKNLRHENIFFAGDAAHIHSPFGGQGMNTGMQDAYNLAWKLNLVIKHKANPSILNSYHNERYPIIQLLINQTEKTTKMMLTRNPFLRVLRDWVMLPLLKSQKANLKLANQLSMLAIHYNKSPLINYKSTMSNKSPQPGELLPDVILSQSDHLKKHQPHGKFWLLVFAGTNPDNKTTNTISEFTQWIEANHTDYLGYHVITPTQLAGQTNQLRDEQNQIASTFNVTRPAFCLIRPDKYIALSANQLDKKKLEGYFEKFTNR